MTSIIERYQRIASVYDALDLPFEYGRYCRLRPLLFEGLSGAVLDAGLGTGRNIPFYPRGTRVVGIAGCKRLAGNRADVSVRLAFCWTHMRRAFFQSYAFTQSPLAADALARIAVVYAIEAEITDHPADPSKMDTPGAKPPDRRNPA